MKRRLSAGYVDAACVAAAVDAPRLTRALRDREAFGDRRVARGLRQWAEERSVYHSNQHYVDLPITTKSTIAIAFSADGRSFASTHGDHTVKVFDALSLREKKVLSGHSRTPWTVKYHPRDSNILASGCLGHEVRVWNAETGQCLAYAEVGGSVMSLSFHPEGSVLAIASGRRESTFWGELYLWDYRNARSVGGAPNPKNVYGHEFGLRCVRFNPSGTALILALANVNPFQAEYPTYQLVINEYDAAQMSLRNARRVLVHQVHLYSDGGLDVSPCGRYLVTCAPPSASAGDARNPRGAALVIVNVRTGKRLKSCSLENILKGRSGEHSPSTVSSAQRLLSFGPHPKGVTSVKFSPSQDLVVLGYGVREEYSRPLNFPHVVTAVFRLSDMSVLSVFTSYVDDVNVARFIPFSGHGILYGSKQGSLVASSPYRPYDQTQGRGGPHSRRLRLPASTATLGFPQLRRHRMPPPPDIGAPPTAPRPGL